MADIGKIESREIVAEMRESYLDYAMSVIVARALPDVRDGLKPVHRRILYTMHEMGLTHGAKFRKSAAIVGDCMGKYHPHGDTAIYDTMVRMAQDFSLRYPLVDGQGNFGCFTKDTKVQLADGRELSFEDLVKEYEAGVQNFTYTINSRGLVSVAEIKQPRLTREGAKLVRVTLDNGERIRCTANHLFMTRDGAYREAQYLTVGDSLMPLYQRLSEKTDRLNREGYVLIHQPKTNEWMPAHHLADNYNLASKTYRKSAGRVRHHRDFNKKNNNPTNIIRLTWGQHWQIHYERATEQHADPEYRKKIAAGREAYGSQSSVRKAYAEHLAKRNKENWNDPTYRERMRARLREINKQYIKEHPEKRQEFSIRATRTLKKLWEDAAYRAFMHEKIIKGNKNHTSNITDKKKFLAICKEVMSRHTDLNEKSYEAVRSIVYPYDAATRWETGLQKYFQNRAELIVREVRACSTSPYSAVNSAFRLQTIRDSSAYSLNTPSSSPIVFALNPEFSQRKRDVEQALKRNHKVVKVENLTERENVYDLTIDGTHNFALAAGIFVHNSIDGDAAAAMRYSEARMTRIAEELLRDIEKDTVDFRENYDGTRKEPIVLPATLPNLLLNGTLGIAVGMATSIPPHNLGEIVDALTHLADHPNTSSDELMQFIKGPDFPTGGFIFNEKEIRAAYASGKGSILNRGRAEIEEAGRGYQIVVTQIPYQVNKAELIEHIANLVQEKKLEGIRDLRDESDRDGLRIVVELKNDAQPQKVLNNLYQHTDLEKSFHLNMLALVDGLQPQVLSVKNVLEEFLKHRLEVITRRARFDLNRARERLHILEGLKKALDHIDRIISTIRQSPDKEAAHANLVKKFQFSPLQATAILEMRLQTLAGLERQKIEDELKEKQALARSLEALLKDPRKIREVAKKEFAEVKEKYGDERRTSVVRSSPKEFSEEDLIPEEEVMVMVTRGGYIKRIKPEHYRIQKRGGKGLIGMETKEEDVVEHLLTCSTHASLLFFTNTGKVYQVPAYEIPEGARIAKGKAIFNFLSLAQSEQITSVLAVGKPAAQKGKKTAAPVQASYIVMLTKRGIIKKVEGSVFENVRRNGLIAITLKSDDALGWAKQTSGSDELLLVTQKAQAIHFSEKDVRPMGRQAAGVTALRLKRDDTVVGMDLIAHAQKGEPANLVIVMENGYGKKTPLKQYKKQKRGGSGIKTAKITPKTGSVVRAEIPAEASEELIAISRKGQVIRTPLSSVPSLGRATQGVRIMKMDAGDTVASITTL